MLEYLQPLFIPSFDSRLQVLEHLCFVTYRKVKSSNTSRLEAHAGFFKLFIKGIFNPYVL